MHTLRSFWFRWLLALTLLLLLGACAAPTPEPAQPRTERPSDTASASPTTFDPSTETTATEEALENTSIPETPTPKPSSTPRPIATLTPQPGLELDTETKLADIKETVPELVPLPVAAGPGKLLPPNDNRCANTDLQDFDVLIFQSLKWKPGAKVNVSVAVPAGKSQFANLEADANGNLQVTFQPGTGEYGFYLVMMSDGTDSRRCTFTYRARKGAGVFMLSPNPFQPVFFREMPGDRLQLSKFDPYEAGKLLVYQMTDKKNEWALLGWQKVKADSTGELTVELGKEPGNRTYVVIGEKSGEVHMWLPDPRTGSQRQVLLGVRVAPNLPTPTLTPIQ